MPRSPKSPKSPKEPEEQLPEPVEAVLEEDIPAPEDTEYDFEAQDDPQDDESDPDDESAPEDEDNDDSSLIEDIEDDARYVIRERQVDKYTTIRERVKCRPSTCDRCGYDVCDINNLAPYDKLPKEMQLQVRSTLDRHMSRHTAAERTVLTGAELKATLL